LTSRDLAQGNLLSIWRNWRFCVLYGSRNSTRNP
jgi:hypothetical protein